MSVQIGYGAAFQAVVEHWSEAVEERLMNALPIMSRFYDSVWKNAVRAAVFNGGKRIRPMLAILGSQVGSARLNGMQGAALDVAAAVEFIHCSSLIFDDLPCMDNAALRRGEATLHLEYGEDKAILVALGLLLKGIELVTAADRKTAVSGRFGELTGRLIECIGPEGLICGQWIDLCAGRSRLSDDVEPLPLRERVIALRNLKTSPLIRFSLIGGAILGGATDGEKAALESFADLIGDAYQIVDDLLDLSANSECSGKDVGLDFKNGRINQALQIDLDRLTESIEAILVKARSIIANNFPSNEARAALEDFTVYLISRFSKEISALECSCGFEERYPIQAR